MLNHKSEELRRGWQGGACACPRPDAERERRDGVPTGSSLCCHCGETLSDGHPLPR